MDGWMILACAGQFADRAGVSSGQGQAGHLSGGGESGGGVLRKYVKRHAPFTCMYKYVATVRTNIYICIVGRERESEKAHGLLSLCASSFLHVLVRTCLTKRNAALLSFHALALALTKRNAARPALPLRHSTSSSLDHTPARTAPAIHSLTPSFAAEGLHTYTGFFAKTVKIKPLFFCLFLSYHE